MSAIVHFKFTEEQPPELQEDGSLTTPDPVPFAQESMWLDHVPPVGAHLWRAAPDEPHEHWLVTEHSWVIVGPTEVGKNRWGAAIVDVYLARSEGPSVGMSPEEAQVLADAE